MNRSTPGLPVHHQHPEFNQTHAHRVGDAIQPSHPLSSPSPPAPNPSQHQGLFQWVNSSHEVVKVLVFQLQHQPFQWTPRADLLQDGLVGSPCSPRDSSGVFSNTTAQKHQFFGAQLSSQSSSQGSSIMCASRQSQQHTALSQACPWKWLPAWERQVTCTFTGQGNLRKEGKSLLLSRSSSRVNQGSHHPHDRLLQFYTPPFIPSQFSPERSSRGFTNLVTLWLHWRQQQYRQMEEKTQVKIMIPKISHMLSYLKSHQDFSGSPVIRTLPFSSGVGSIPGQRAKISQA